MLYSHQDTGSHRSSYSSSYQYEPRSNVQQRPLHWCIILVSLLFVFLLVIESVAFVILGAWHLTTRHFQDMNITFANQVHQRELTFGIVLVLIGSIGILMSILGLMAFFTLRLFLLRVFGICLWIMMIAGIAIGIIGIIFSSQVNGYMQQMSNTSVSDRSYAEEKFMLGMNGGLVMFMSLILIIGIVIVRCITGDVSVYASDRKYGGT
ncbi:hypothetical protein I4U23_028343 [Adineta vaga]|nr:hypothetical protein I4U23_028343 [Adineta vaga]